MTQEDPGMPCGKCAVGVYDYGAAFNPIADALNAGGVLPSCKTFNRICVGAIHCKEFRAGYTELKTPALAFSGANSEEKDHEDELSSGNSREHGDIGI